VQKFTITVFLAYAMAGAAFAAPTSNYDVEVLVIENRLADLEGAESLAHTVPASLIAEIAGAEVAGLPQDDGGLTEAGRRLEKDGRFRVLAHKRWSQTADAKSATKPVRINDAAQRLDGVLRFYLSRFLHVDMELVLKDGVGGSPGEPLAYHLNEHRRVRTQETHYFDHPKFGVLLRVTQAGKP
jgi:hypothetical protein